MRLGIVQTDGQDRCLPAAAKHAAAICALRSASFSCLLMPEPPHTRAQADPGSQSAEVVPQYVAMNSTIGVAHSLCLSTFAVAL
jgi:uncharacterized protein with von Willebrand factor type A (vWA) domain